MSWKLSTHYNNSSGNIVHCAECHLPPEGHGYLPAKAKHGAKDVYGFLFKDSADINWEEKGYLRMPKNLFMRNHVSSAIRTCFLLRYQQMGAMLTYSILPALNL